MKETGYASVARAGSESDFSPPSLRPPDSLSTQERPKVKHAFVRIAHSVAQHDPRLEKAIQLVLSNPECSITNIARALGLSCSGLAHLMKRHKNVSLRNARCAFRISEAVRLLQEANLSIKEISSSLGYAQSASFVRHFTRWCGLPPGRWRKSAQIANKQHQKIRDFPCVSQQKKLSY
jgi:AraC-like DNA-binding protein